MLAESSADFAFRLYHQLVAEHPGENVFLSPFSICVALAMALEGAAGRTAEEMFEVLAIPDTHRIQFGPEMAQLLRTLTEAQNDPIIEARKREIEELRQSLAEQQLKFTDALGRPDPILFDEHCPETNPTRARLQQLLYEVNQFELSSANALFGEQTCPFKRAFLDRVKSLYGTGLTLCDFKNNAETEIQRINRWASEQTRGRIPQTLSDEDVGADTALILVNAIYFNGEWHEPFEKSQTTTEPFTCPGGRQVESRLMNQPDLSDGRYAAFHPDGRLFETPEYYPGDLPAARYDNNFGYPGPGGVQVLELLYRGEEISMLLVLPHAATDLSALEDQLDVTTIHGYLDRLERRYVTVTLPKFKTRTDYKLNDTLSTLGMPAAFTNPLFGDGADFSKMAEPVGEPLYVSQVVHKAMCDVNEKGTEAAAVTALCTHLMGEDPGHLPFVPVFRADRPFLYLILHRSTRTILFLGRMLDPTG